jgi:hypothetical protein
MLLAKSDPALGVIRGAARQVFESILSAKDETVLLLLMR